MHFIMILWLNTRALGQDFFGISGLGWRIYCQIATFYMQKILSKEMKWEWMLGVLQGVKRLSEKGKKKKKKKDLINKSQKEIQQS